jgi:hypothetical protein
MSEKGQRKPPPGSIKISLWLVPGTPEFKAYNCIVKKYVKETANRQDAESDDTPVKRPYVVSDIARASILAFADVPQEKVPDYVDAAWKHKGRKSSSVDADAGSEPDADSVDDRPTLLH